MSKTPMRFLTDEEAARREDRYSFEVTIFSSLGLYPEGTFHVPDGFFHADKEIAFSVAWSSSWKRLDPELPYSELRTLSPDHLRLVAAIMFCEKRDGARLSLYPVPDQNLILNRRRLNLRSSDVIKEIQSLVIQQLNFLKTPEARWSQHCTFARPYELWPSKEFALERMENFWLNLNPLDYKIARGVHALMKADMLSTHREFWEEATVSCYVALDASFSYIKELLAEKGTPNATAHDAALWLHEHFNAPFGLPLPDAFARYFEDMYDQRVMTLHPSSRLGEHPIAPMMYEDYMYLRRQLREIFAYFVAGKHGDDYYRNLAEASRFRVA